LEEASHVAEEPTGSMFKVTEGGGIRFPWYIGRSSLYYKM